MSSTGTLQVLAFFVLYSKIEDFVITVKNAVKSDEKKYKYLIANTDYVRISFAENIYFLINNNFLFLIVDCCSSVHKCLQTSNCSLKKI